ncbi:PREDICTED: neural cell adhesion molecule 2-like [Nestor notabilis]|uniref:neural cell adhesion molecule 2-like n=1 Tax=Nestor notabilis TaxID=176057 RepID=UPI000523B2A2|nr:PREDICTED: neural cell adhesion molecule 2-like [Nestor notabilis]
MKEEDAFRDSEQSCASPTLQKKKVHKEPKTGEKADDSNASHPTTGCSHIPVTLWGVGDKGKKAHTLFNGLGLGAVIGLGVAALLLILVVTDVTCFFVRQCGLLMCITRRICGKKGGSSGKSKELEEGKAAYLKDGSKEPIVEMRTEDERITNHEDGSPVNEPNETTPLTEPEKLPLKEENGKEALNAENIEIKVANDIIQSKEDDSKA